jgi:SAM-dependent methyltransferase
MFNNFVNVYDLLKVVEKIKEGAWGKISSKLIRLGKSREKNIKDVWEHLEINLNDRPVHWWDLPKVRERWNYLISGNPSVDYIQYISNKYLAQRNSLTGLSLGCGPGFKELGWVETGKFNRIDAFDISENSIAYARRAAKEKGYGDILNYFVADVHKAEFKKYFYDIIFVEHSLHHFSSMKELLLKIKESLGKDGYFIINEFVGPSRFQWTHRQLQATDGVLALLPLRYRTLWNSTSIVSEVIKPSRLSMILSDPSEAVESASIMPLLREIFDVVEIKEYGGNILHLLFTGIAHNFISEDTKTTRILDFCFKTEDVFLSDDKVQSDFVVAICRNG